jgi:orotidine-5'-phosphate decarboxylase
MNATTDTINLREKLIVALDVPSKSEALALVTQLAGQISVFKIGLQLYLAEGPDIVRAIADLGGRIFLDLKLHDIPNTVAKAVASVRRLGIEMLTVHLSGGRTMIEEAVAASEGQVLVVGVTVLTSVDPAGLAEVGVESTVDEQALRLATLGHEAGLCAFVASPREISSIRDSLGNDLKLIAPGVRPTWSAPGDQKRFSTPRQALAAGADYLVIGRPIIAHQHPAEAVAKIFEELAS